MPRTTQSQFLVRIGQRICLTIYMMLLSQFRAECHGDRSANEVRVMWRNQTIDARINAKMAPSLRYGTDLLQKAKSPTE